MSELDLIAQFKDDPLAQTIIGGVVLIKIIEYTIKYAPRIFLWLFSKEKVMPFWKWQDYILKKIGEIETKIVAISAVLSTHEFLLDKTSQGTLENQLFNDDPDFPAFIRLKAFRRLLAMRKNGRIWERGMAEILKNRKTIKDDSGKIVSKIDVWLDVLDTELGIDIVDVEYYEARLKEIRRKIYDDFSEK